MKPMNLPCRVLAVLVTWTLLSPPDGCLAASNEVQEVLKRARLGAEANDLLKLERCEIVTTNTWSVRYEKAPFQAQDYLDVTTYRRDGVRKLSILRRYQRVQEEPLKLGEESYKWNEEGKTWSLVLVLYGNPPSVRVYPDTSILDNHLESEFRRDRGSATLPRDYDHCYEILQRARSVEVKGRSVEVDGFACIALQARTEYGDYTVYLDPAHDYLLRKGSCQKITGDLHAQGMIVGAKLPAINPVMKFMGRSKRIESSIEGTDIAKLGSLQYVRAVSATVVEEFEHGKYICTSRMTRTLDLAPNFSRPESLKPAIPDGTAVVFGTLSHETGHGVWDSGKVVER
jgi:hypothetical protein